MSVDIGVWKKNAEDWDSMSDVRWLHAAFVTMSERPAALQKWRPHEMFSPKPQY